MKKVLGFIFVFLINSSSFLQAQWVQTNYLFNDPPISIVVNGSNIFMASGNRVYLSTNNGISWTNVSSGLPNIYICCLATNGNYVFAGTFGGGIYRTTDNGNNWTNVTSNFQSQYTYSNIVYSIIANDSTIFAGTREKIIISRDRGNTWKDVNSSFAGTNVRSFAISGTNIIASNYECEIYLSSNNGVDWKLISYGLPRGTSGYGAPLTISGNNFITGIEGKIYLSTDSGASWNYISLNLQDYSIQNFVSKGPNVFVGRIDGIYISSDNGKTWGPINYILYKNIFCLAVSDSNIFAGAYAEHGQFAVFRRPLSELITYIKDNKSNFPNFFLDQNYPNPFNPTTNISYSIPQSANVTLKVYDLLGREVVELVNGEKNPGRYEVRFDGSNLTSGVYFYRLTAGSFSQTKKLLLIK